MANIKNTGVDVEPLELAYISSQSVSGTNTLENWLAISNKDLKGTCSMIHLVNV